MIGGASLPKAALPMPASHATASHTERADEARDTAAAPRAPSHAEASTAHAGHAPRDAASASKLHAAARNQRSTRRERGTRDGDDAPTARDAFARLLDQAPAPSDATKATPPVASDATSQPATSGTTPASLPDQLLGLLASLAPGAQPAAQATPASTTPSTPAAATATPPAALPATAAPAKVPVGADAATALLPLLQAGTGALPANAESTTTAALALAAHAEDGGTPLPGAHDTRPDTPAPAPFDALVRATAPTAPDVARPVVPATPAPVTQPTDPRAGYGDELGGSVVWMADQRISHAEVRVVPDHLGPIDVKLQLDGAQVHATFLSAQPEVRHALEASLPRLRDLLGQHGLQLAQADVGERQADSRATRGERPVGDGRGGDDDGLATMAPTATPRVVRGLLDEYA